MLNAFSVWIEFHKHCYLVILNIECNDWLVKVLVQVTGKFLDLFLEIPFAVIEELLSIKPFAFALRYFVADQC